MAAKRPQDIKVLELDEYYTASFSWDQEAAVLFDSSLSQSVKDSDYPCILCIEYRFSL